MLTARIASYGQHGHVACSTFGVKPQKCSLPETHSVYTLLPLLLFLFIHPPGPPPPLPDSRGRCRIVRSDLALENITGLCHCRRVVCFLGRLGTSDVIGKHISFVALTLSSSRLYVFSWVWPSEFIGEQGHLSRCQRFVLCIPMRCVVSGCT